MFKHTASDLMMTLDKSKLYKFRPFDTRTIDILINNEVWCAHASSFNDPFEFSVKIDFSFTPDANEFRKLFLDEYKMAIEGQYKRNMISHDEYLKLINSRHTISDEQLLTGYHNMQGLFKETAQKAIKFAKDSFRIFSLSMTNQHPLLWGHYADGVRGVCIEFDFSYTSMPIIPVNYKTSPPTIFSDRFVKPDTGLTSINDELFGYKHKSWRYEKEARLIAHIDSLHENKHTLKLEQGAIKSITLGSLMSKNNQNIILSIAKEKDIPVYHAIIDRYLSIKMVINIT